tara:strand:+ start:148 stop:831 length:684 start_codon:yes stop_codon:yes gene_type:complete
MIFKQEFDTNSSTYTYIIASAKGREAVIIDPVIENVDSYIKILGELDLKLVKVIDTHIHADHVTGADKLKKATNCTTLMGEHTPADTVEIKVKDGEYIDIDSLKIQSLYTPGHTSDSYSFLLDSYLFTGDTLLINGTGRTDFQNGSSRDAYNSLFNKILKLPDETLVYPGHDYNGKFSSTIGNEKKNNPRLQVNNVNEYEDIMSNLNLARPKLIESNVSRNIKLGAN